LGAKANIGETSLLELARSLAKAMGRDEIDPEFAPERSVNPVPRRLASTAKAERLLDFRAAIPLEEGLRELVDWWRVERQRLSAPAELEAAAS
jgi:UDP-glucose 4-epimerase